jgi:hypothetical protein
MKRWPIFCLLLIALNGCQTTPANRAALLSRAHLTEDEGLPVLFLSGTPYELGYQCGVLLRDRIRDHYTSAFRFMETLPKFRMFTRWQVNWKLDSIWNDLQSHVPREYLEEMQGLSDGSGVSLADIHRAHAIPDAFPTQCSVGAFWGSATVGGRFYQIRNLDWSRSLGVHRYPCIFVVSPQGKYRFINVGFIGFIGALSGMNQRGICIGQVGSRSVDETHDGVPFIFLLRRILEEADGTTSAAQIVRGSPRTVGINYVIGSALEKRAVALETTARHFAEFHDADPAEAVSPFAVPLTNAVFRSDTAFDPGIRKLQTCSNGDPKQKQVSDPHGSSAYDRRYLLQARMAEQQYGRIGTNEVFALAKKIAMKSNIQSVVYAYPELWVAYAKGDARAVDCDYHHFNLEQLLAK